MILDLYAGAGGWDEGARQLGLDTVGLELWHDACVTAVRAHHPRIRCDIATYPTAPFAGRVTGLIASPPCQAWSMAGNRKGEQDKARVHELVNAYAAGANGPGDGHRWSMAAEDSARVTVGQAAILQSFPPDYPWHGNKTSQFLQVGNAVPPGLAAAVLAVAAGVPAVSRLDLAA